MENRTRNAFLITATSVVWIAALLVGCETQDSFPRHHHVNNVYEVVGKLCVIEDLLKDERIETLDVWQRHAERFTNSFAKIPLGTKIKIESIEKKSEPKESIGRFYWYVVFVSVLAEGHEGIRYDASHLMHGEHRERFGDNGSNLITLKLVSEGKK